MQRRMQSPSAGECETSGIVQYRPTSQPELRLSCPHYPRWNQSGARGQIADQRREDSEFAGLFARRHAAPGLSRTLGLNGSARNQRYADSQSYAWPAAHPGGTTNGPLPFRWGLWYL